MLAAGAGSRSISLLIAPRYACADHDNDAADGDQITPRSHYLLGGRHLRRRDDDVGGGAGARVGCDGGLAPLERLGVDELGRAVGTLREIQPRYSRDLAEIWPRSSRDTAEIQRRSS